MTKYVYDGFSITKLQRESSTGAYEPSRRSHGSDSRRPNEMPAGSTVARARSAIAKAVQQVEAALEAETSTSTRKSDRGAKPKRRAPGSSKSRRVSSRAESVTPVVAARQSPPPEVILALPEEFDVAISFAKPERGVAEQLAVALRERGVTVFYDRFYEEHLWGADLAEVLDDVFRKRARFCIIFVSHEYAQRIWTTHERRSATARAVLDRDRHYILPIRIDDTELPGLRSDIGYLSLKESSIDRAVELLLKKLGGHPTRGGA